ncbi:NAD-reducing hydrogenase HoxS subunit alpha [mine drainage metagenome]|uniref:NAD-reducing hydrogenase HoxS subunit alpha n=1 Tax=mine drainage metagenome TaxID=410659 RepID=A0A1J5RPU3_9ZZZZ
MSDTDLDALLDRHRHDAAHLVQILIEAQELTGWLPREMLAEIARRLDLSYAEVLGVAGFYRFLHTEPAGRYRVLWSDNITDRMLGSEALMAQMCTGLWTEPGRVSEDGLVSVATASCTGMCDQGPALLVNGRALTAMNTERVAAMVELIRAGSALQDWPREWFAVHDNIRRQDILLGHRLAPGEALAAALARGGEATLAEIDAAGLRGRGGAGFATGQKWRATRDAPVDAAVRYVVCNADEGEPGTFKDRVLLGAHADLVFEGMTIAGRVIGARLGLLYLRGEYRHLLEPLQATLAARRAAHLLGRNILGVPGFDFDIEIRLGAGAYVCGEESALIESLEGKRGTPRIRPPFPVTHGYLGCPTAVNNVETLAAACLIARHGGAWYAGIGSAKSAGTKLLSVSGDCARPGIYEYPFGVTIRQVLADCAAEDTLAVQVSGPSGACLSADEFGRKLAFEDLPTAGALMVFDHRRDLFEVARNFAHFFAHESCGFCTPCRVGTTLAARLMDKIAAGHGSPDDLNELFKLQRLMQAASHCGLGHSAGNALADTLNKFRPAYERRLKSLEFEPAFDLDAALSQARQMTGRDDAAAHLAKGSAG